MNSLSQSTVEVLQGSALFEKLSEETVLDALTWESKDLPRRSPRLVGFGFLALACLSVFALGLPSG